MTPLYVAMDSEVTPLYYLLLLLQRPKPHTQLWTIYLCDVQYTTLVNSILFMVYILIGIFYGLLQPMFL